MPVDKADQIRHKSQKCSLALRIQSKRGYGEPSKKLELVVMVFALPVFALRMTFPSIFRSWVIGQTTGSIEGLTEGARKRELSSPLNRRECALSPRRSTVLSNR